MKSGMQLIGRIEHQITVEFRGSCLHATSIILGLRHPDIKSSPLICGVVLGLGHVTLKRGLPITVVERQLVKGCLQSQCSRGAATGSGRSAPSGFNRWPHAK